MKMEATSVLSLTLRIKVQTRRLQTESANRCVWLCVPCLSRIPVQRPGARRGGGPRPRSAAAAPGAGGRQLLLPAPLRPAHVHHSHALQQEDGNQRQGQRDGGGQGGLPVSIHLLLLQIFDQLFGFLMFASRQALHAWNICCGCINNFRDLKG